MTAGTSPFLALHLRQLEDVERRIEDAARTIRTEHAGLADLARRVADAAVARRSAIAQRREQLGVRTTDGPELLTATRGLAALIADAAVSSAAVHAVAHRGFDSQGHGNTADLAEAHLVAHLRELETLLDLVSDLVVHELTRVGEECHCQCPACGIGLCLCSPHGTSAVRQARGAAGAEPAPAGLGVRRPRRGSAADVAGVCEGERVLGIDGVDIAHDLDIATVQSAIRARASGEELRVRVAGLDGSVREVQVRRP